MPIPLKKESDLPDELQFLWKTRRRSTSEAREPPPNASHPPTELNSTVPAIFAVIRAGVFFGRTLFRRRSAGARKKIESFKYDNYYQTEEIRKLDFAAGHLTGGGGGGGGRRRTSCHAAEHLNAAIQLSQETCPRRLPGCQNRGDRGHSPRGIMWFDNTEISLNILFIEITNSEKGG